MQIDNRKPSVITFEQAVLKKNYAQAYDELCAILERLDLDFGAINQIEMDIPNQLMNMEQDIYVLFCTRMANALTQFFQDPDLEILLPGALHLFSLQRWMAVIFASSPYVNADHILRSYNVKADVTDPNDVHIESSQKSVIKFCLLYFLDSNVLLNIDNIWTFSPDIAASLCIALLSPRFVGSTEGFSKRHALLQWFPKKLIEFKNLDSIMYRLLHDVYMHCSYDIAPNKHDIKRSINQVIRQHLLSSGWQDRKNLQQIGYKDGKPVMVVLLEHFNTNHSIYRTHSTSMIAAKQHFYLIGLGDGAIDEKGRAVFDEFHVLENMDSVEHIHAVKEICEQNKASIFYMPSLGMLLATIFASNVRIAPIQVVALGHPATAHSQFIDYVVVEDDYVGSEKCFSETLIRLPKDALPYVPSELAPETVNYCLRDKPEVVQIGIAATTMKLNPEFLTTLRVIRDQSKVPVHFHFAVGLSLGVIHPYVCRVVRSYLGDSATVHPQLPYPQYLDVLHKCDMMVNPFPFGNTNGIIDMVTLGLVGICKTGDEVHEHIDEGLFTRLGLPQWLVAHSIDEYIHCTLRLIENHDERLALRKYIIDNNKLGSLFMGNPNPLGDVLFNKLEEWKKGIVDKMVADF